jgi:hypothetical protein
MMLRISQTANEMLPNVVEFLSQYPLTATDATSMAVWREKSDTAWTLLADTYLSEADAAYGTSLLHTMLTAYQDLAHLVAFKSYSATDRWPLAERSRHLEALINRPQVEQRTEQWYKDAANLLTASQFGTLLLKGPRARASLVMDKASGTVDTSSRRTVVLTEELNAFTWGIRFEPVVKQVYQVLTGTQVVDLGRLRHRSDSHLAASPDGLVVKGPEQRLARFVEFKAPVSRVINNTIPEEYQCQMQIQMEVGDVEECDYLEAKFSSPFGMKSCPEKPESAPYWGTIYIIGNSDGHLLRYEYSPLKDDEWRPILEETECIVSSVPWWLDTWYLTTVGRSRTWFQSIQPKLEAFWTDVEAAKRGEFIVPESSRKKKESSCKFVDSNSQNGEDVPTTPLQQTQSLFVEDT